jgi:hypothetical protein
MLSVADNKQAWEAVQQPKASFSSRAPMIDEWKAGRQI